jgi:ABC-type nitrate/sulfonate/bicarbonate transport system permease component
MSQSPETLSKSSDVAAIAGAGARRLAKRAKTYRTMRRIVCGIISFGILLVIWHFAVGTILNSTLVASPEETFFKGEDMLLSGELLRHVGVSLERVLVGYVIGCVLGILFGAVIGRYRLVADFVDPVLELVRPISPVALVPLPLGGFSRWPLYFFTSGSRDVA